MTGEREGVTIVERWVQDLLKARGEILIQDISFSLRCGGDKERRFGVNKNATTMSDTITTEKLKIRKRNFQVRYAIR